LRGGVTTQARLSVHTDSQSSDLDTWTSLVLTGRRAQVEVILADLQRKYGDDLEVVKGPFQHRGSWDWEVRCKLTIALLHHPEG
jgi:hypothetical protein